MARTSRRGPWLPEEDSALIELVRTQGPNNWVRISQQLQHRSPKQCRERYHQNLKPSLNHDPISAEEGEKIEQLVDEMGKRWAEIARRLGNRSDNAVKNWWNGSINRRKRSPSSQHSVRHTIARLHPISTTSSQMSCREGGDPARASPSSASLRPEHHFRDPWSTHQAAAPSQAEHSPADASYRAGRYESFPRTIGHLPHVTIDEQRHGEKYSSSQRHEVGEEYTRLPPIRLPSISSHYLDSGYVSGHEVPSVSPSISEFSNTNSTRPVPSLISDNQSTCSVSPKFVTSPHVSGNYNSDARPYRTSYSERPQSFGYQGLKGQFALSPLQLENLTMPPILNRPAEESRCKSGDYSTERRYSAYDSTVLRRTEPLRDRRMHVSSLVQ